MPLSSGFTVRARGSAFQFRSCVLVLAMVCWLAVVPAAQAQSILRDAETEAFLKKITTPVLKAANIDPDKFEYVLVGDTTPNAFAATGLVIYVHSGLILNATNVDQIIGVMAHETGHVAGGHVFRTEDGTRAASRISILSLLLAAAAIAAGAGEAGIGILGGGQQAALGSYLAYSRAQESSADQAAAHYLDVAGISGRGLLEFFEYLQGIELQRTAGRTITYAGTHPYTGDRIQALTERMEKSAAWNKPTDPELQKEFLLIKAKLFGFSYDANRTLQTYPETDTTDPAHYARAYAWHKLAFTDRAAREVDALLQDEPKNPYFLELKGQVLLESGRVKDAIPPLRSAYSLLPRQPLIGSLLGHALLATDDNAYTEEARTILKEAVAADAENPFAWYQLGIAYYRSGDEARAKLASAEHYGLVGAPDLALRNAVEAARALPRGSPDWLRSQDIIVFAEDQLKRQKRRRG